MTNKEKFDLICSCLDRAIYENGDRLPLETQRGTNINLVKRENGNYKIVFNTEKETYEAITKDNLYKFLFEGWRGNETLGREDGRITLFEAIHQYIQSHCDLIIPLEKRSLSKMIPLNQILYGPPGTGKTYNTITKALEIIDGSAPSKREDAKAKFEEYRKSGQIEFVTFHQSYGYEEFVEGIRAIPVGEEGNEDGEEMIYAVKDGILKKMSKLSLENYTKNNHAVTPKRKFFLHAKTLNIQAEMIEEDSNTYRVLKGSKIRKGQAASFENYNYIALKNKLLGDAKLKEETEFYILEEDYIFQSMSAASSVILGRQSNGYNDWKEISDENNLFTQDQEKRNYILIIDEINRGNISKIFGELITLIEPSKRIGAEEAIKLRLPYSNEEFGVPQNLYILGTMNTADRSIALMDTALRRRFYFEEMMPDVETLNDKHIEGIDLKKILTKINQRIEYLYDRDHTIGHAYFIDVENKNDLDDVMRNKILPLLQEYFYDDWEKILMVLGDDFVDKREVKSDIFDYKPDDYLEDEKFIYSIKERFDYTKLQS